MKKYVKHFFDNEILSYLFFGVATTVVAVLTRMLCYALTSNELLATALGNIAGILWTWDSHSFLSQHFLTLSVNLSTMTLKRSTLLKHCLLKSLLLCLIMFLVKSLYLKINRRIKKTNLPQWWFVCNFKEP